MQTQLADSIAATPQGLEADAILRSCSHCGFCSATCPTYQLLGNEDDSPRGRIYLIKSVLEGNAASAATQKHLDRCLTCRACETTCPSGVNYHRLLDIGRDEVDRQVVRPMSQRALRWLITTVMPQRRLFSPLLKLGQWFRPLTPRTLREKIPVPTKGVRKLPETQHNRSMLLLEGCVQPAMAPNINIATARVLDAIGISLQPTPGAGCCGALRQHLSAQQDAKNDMRRNVDVWTPALEAGAEAIVINTSGCGPQVKEYGTLLADDSDYAQRAAKVSAASFDLAEILIKEEAALNEKLSDKASPLDGRKVAFHSPCTLQHGQRIIGVVERLLSAAGCEVLAVKDSHLCCGSAGTYSIFQPDLSRQLRDDKLTALTAGSPEVIATANIGCLAHMAPSAAVPVKHWIELLDEALTQG
ncbi:MAG: glycolate oxidase subunit GlcF [Halieaceae bacterium]